METDIPALVQRLTEFLSVGGLFNPGETAMVNPDATRRLILDCRDALEAQAAEIADMHTVNDETNAALLAEVDERDRLRAERDANLAAWERVLGQRSEGEAHDYVNGLRAALEKIANTAIPGGGLAVDAWMASIARKALRGKKP